MLEIVLLILKTVGVIFVSVLGILIVLIGTALFVPVRYRGDFLVSDKGDSGKRTAVVKLRAAWLLRLVRVYAAYEEAPRVQVKFLFFTLIDTAKEKKTKRGKKGRKRKNKEEKRGETEHRAEETGGYDVYPAEEEISGGPDEKPGSGGKGKETAKDENAKAPDQGNTKQKEEESSSKEKGTIKNRISNILQTIRNFCDKLKGIREKTERLENLWMSSHMVNSRSLLWRQLCYLLKHTKPKKLSGYLRFGFDDPSTTGYAMAAYGILYPIWNPELSVEPDFEKQVLDCHVLLKGKIRVWHFVRAGLWMILSKDVRHVIKDVRNFR